MREMVGDRSAPTLKSLLRASRAPTCFCALFQTAWDTLMYFWQPLKEYVVRTDHFSSASETFVFDFK